MQLLKKIGKWCLRILAVFAVLILILLVWFYFAVRIDEPVITSSKEILKAERQKLGNDFYVLGNNWLRRSETGLWEMYVEGDGFERGVIEGKLNKELAEQQEEAFVAQIRKMVPSENVLNYLKYFIAWFNRNLDEYVISEYQQEIYGESLYASDKFDFIAPKYHRMLNYHAAHDIGHAIQDKNMIVGCTAFGEWGENTFDSSLIIGRNFDFYVGDDFARNKIINFVSPKKGHKFMMVSWAGMIGAVSGMNVKGLTVTINASKSEIPTSAATPISLVAREILQYASTIQEAFEIARKRTVFVSESIMIGSQIDGRTATIEKTPSKTVLFESSVKDRLICANHFQGKSFDSDPINLENIRNSSSYYRLERMAELLDGHKKLSVQDAASILRDRAGKNGKDIGYGNEKAMNQLLAHHGIIFKPSELKVWISANPYQLGQFVCYDLDEVFALASGKKTPEEVYDIESSIAADSFLLTDDFKRFVNYRKWREQIKLAIKPNSKSIINEQWLSEFRNSNPRYYETYWLLGDYYARCKDRSNARKHYLKALDMEISTLAERQQIEKSLANLEIHED